VNYVFHGFFVRVRKKIKFGKIPGGLSPEFWVGHLLVMVSTILGVYLAAHSGLKTAVEFDSLRADRDNYYLRANLRDEILFNVSVSEKIIKKINKHGTFYRSNYSSYQLYIMETMKEQPNALHTPNAILNGTLRYYDKVDRLIRQRKKRWISYPKLAKELRKEIDLLRETVLTQLDNNLISLKTHLDENGVEVDDLI